MDLLALYQPRNNVPLDEMAKLIGFPGKLGMDGAQVWGAYLGGRLREIRSYCETDAANTYLLYLRFQLLRGVFDATQYARETELVRLTLGRTADAHWREFLDAWK
jgi:predicted PolB exonuclease-like 3'-5' exonuclease